jgi:hypothetical protein
MKTYRRLEEYSTNLQLCNYGRASRPGSFTPGKSRLPYPLNRRLGLNDMEEIKILPLQGIKPRSSYP